MTNRFTERAQNALNGALREASALVPGQHIKPCRLFIYTDESCRQFMVNETVVHPLNLTALTHLSDEGLNQFQFHRRIQVESAVFIVSDISGPGDQFIFSIHHNILGLRFDIGLATGQTGMDTIHPYRPVRPSDMFDGMLCREYPACLMVQT